MSKAIRVSIFLMAAGAALTQDVVVTSSAHRVNLTPRPALVTFVPTTADTVDGAAKDAVLSTAQGQAVASTLGRAVPIPIVGPFAAPLVGAALNKLHPPKPVTGFTIAFIPGLSAATVVPQGEISFMVPGAVLEGAKPVVLRVKPSAKDSTRIVRSLHLSVKVTGSSVTPNAKNAHLLGVGEELIPCSAETRDGNAILIPNAPLEAGEYAVAMVPASQDVMAPVGTVWDFRIAPGARSSVTPATASGEPVTINQGQTPAQVVATIGKPEIIAKLGAKEIYFYKSLKVIFVNSKVTDVQ